MRRDNPYLRLLRPANLVTAGADVLAGFAVGAAASRAIPLDPTGGMAWLAGADPARLSGLVAAGVCLYGGGVVLNDVFDAEMDAVERPERPIPSGQADRMAAMALGAGLLVSGIVFALLAAGAQGGSIAAAIAAMAVLYDAAAKRHPVAGPLVIASCRGLNLLLGATAFAGALAGMWAVALVPLAYIAGITLLSRGEVHGGRRLAAWAAVVLMGAAFAALAALPWFAGGTPVQAISLAPFLAFLAFRVVPPFVRAVSSLAPGDIRQAVHAAIVSVIALDAAIAAPFGGWAYGLAILALLPLSAGLGRRFAVT